MPFKKGNPGRPKGALGKDTRTVRDMIESALGRSIPEEMLRLAGENKQDKLRVMESLLPYTYRKLAPEVESQSVEQKQSVDASLVANVVELLKLKVRGTDEPSAIE